MHYKTEQDIGDASKLEQAIGNLQQKFAKKEPLTNNMKELVLKPFAVECSLEAETAFNVLDGFFSKAHNQFYHFEHINKRIQEFMRQVQSTMV